MHTVSSITEQVIKESPYMEEALSMGIINLSSLARKLKPKIDGVNLKRNSHGAIVMALQRIGQKLKSKTFGKSKILLPNELILRSNIVEYIFALSPSFVRLQYELINQLKNQKDVYIATAQGVAEATIFISGSAAQKIEQLFKKEKLLFKLDKLSCIFLRFSEDTYALPGVYYNVFKALAWEGVPVGEVISVGNELSLIFADSQIQKALPVIQGLIKS